MKPVQKTPVGHRFGRCVRPPEGWLCSRSDGHDGPCAAAPATQPVGEQEPLAYLVTAVKEGHRRPHVALEYNRESADARANHWRARGCVVAVQVLGEIAPAETAQQAEHVPDALRKAFYVKSESGPGSFKLTLAFESLPDLQAARASLCAAHSAYSAGEQGKCSYQDDPRSAAELSLVGCCCVLFGEGNPHWPCKIHSSKVCVSAVTRASSRIMGTLANLAKRQPLRAIEAVCEEQGQVSTRRLATLAGYAGDELADCAFALRQDYDALAAECERLRDDEKTLSDALDLAAKKLDQQLAEVARLGADAERWNKLKASVRGGSMGLPDGWIAADETEEWDRVVDGLPAIDAAMAQREAGE